MELRHLRYFVTLAGYLHFGRAAIQLGITQPSLSEQIRQLEGELHTTLLRRTNRRVQLTDSGRLFLDEACDILARADLAMLVARRSSEGDVERVRVGFAHWMDATNLTAVIERLDRVHPRLLVEVRTMSVPSQIAALLEGRLDVGLVRPPIVERSLIVEPLAVDTFIVALSRRHRLAKGRSISLSTLAKEHFILFPRDSVPQFHDLTLNLCRDAGFVPHVRHEVDHPDLVFRLVAAGLGISLVPGSTAKAARPGVAYRPLQPAARILETAVAWQRDNASPAIKAFTDVAKEVFERSR